MGKGAQKRGGFVTEWKTRCWAYEVEDKPLPKGFHGPLVEEAEAEAKLAAVEARDNENRRKLIAHHEQLQDGYRKRIAELEAERDKYYKYWQKEGAAHKEAVLKLAAAGDGK